MNEVALFEMHVKKFAGHLGFHGDGVASDVADGSQLHWHGPLRDLRHNDGNSRRVRRRRRLLLRTPGGRHKNEKKRGPESEFRPAQGFRFRACEHGRMTVHIDLFWLALSPGGPPHLVRNPTL